MGGIFLGSRKPSHYVSPIFVAHHQEVRWACWSDMREVLDGEWSELKICPWKTGKKGEGRDHTPSLGIAKSLGYCENRICLQVSIIGFEETERKTSTLVEEYILNCSTEKYQIKNQALTGDANNNGPDGIQELLCILICFRVKRFHQWMVEGQHIVWDFLHVMQISLENILAKKGEGGWLYNYWGPTKSGPIVVDVLEETIW